jgi:hypothetical protein
LQASKERLFDEATGGSFHRKKKGLISATERERDEEGKSKERERASYLENTWSPDPMFTTVFVAFKASEKIHYLQAILVQ